jgi:predicted HNH restriction endonuclease
VHHKRPVHLFPELELDPANLITLCEPQNCHYLIGHCLSWKAYNPSVEEDAAHVREMIASRLAA